MYVHSCKHNLKQQPPVNIVLGVGNSVLLDDALRWQVGYGTAEAVSADVISPGQAVPPRQPEIRYLRRGWRLDEPLGKQATTPHRRTAPSDCHVYVLAII